MFKDASVREAPPTRTTDSERKSVFKSCGSQSFPKGRRCRATNVGNLPRGKPVAYGEKPAKAGSPIQLLKRLRPKRNYAAGFTTPPLPRLCSAQVGSFRQLLETLLRSLKASRSGQA
ncbi:MAG: hypothetical protein V7K40_09675 [Nostoc sp.]|uniref:hypothetical protein n=1 Tax=Nostoc sp. TaxID=1180 RepID=UPI002FF98FC2